MNLCKQCKKEKQLLTGDFDHTIFGTTITIKNVPYYHCDICGESAYVSHDKVESTLKDAYRKKQTECNYE